MVATDASKEKFVIDCNNIEDESSNSMNDIEESVVESISLTNEFDC